MAKISRRLQESARKSKLALENFKEQEERILLAGQRHLRTIFDKNPDGMIVVDNQGVVCFANPAAESFFGLKKNKLLAHPFGVPAMDGEATEINVIQKDGKTGTLQMRTVQIEWDKKPSHLILIHDITPIREAEQLRYEVDERRKLDQLKNEFISTVSHELRTPLATMKEFVSILLDEVPGKINEEQKEYLNITRGNIDRLVRIVTDLLDISKIEAKKMVIRKSLVDIVGLARGTISMLKASADAKNISLEMLSPERVPDIYADPDRITQVFTNLIHNAIKFTPQNGRVTVEIKTGEKEIACSVSDTGIGIAAENRDKLFCRFMQIDRSAGDGPKGTGLGLSITKELVGMYGGKIWVESEFGEGSKFIFTLPVLSSQAIFKEYINNGIKDAAEKGTAFSTIIISFNNFQDTLKKLGVGTISQILNDLEEVTKKALRRVTDMTIKNREEVVILLPDVKRGDASAVKNRLEDAVKAYVQEKKALLDGAWINLGIATFPDDTENGEELINKARCCKESIKCAP
ncbi:MAG: ATP-binding protein [Candidatus Omnitrophota bacterium]